jgi:hypothetical protein
MHWGGRLLFVSIVLLGIIAGVGGSPETAHAITITVDDPGNGAGSCPGSPCTLRGAITLANANPGSTIEFDKGPGDIHPGSALPSINVAMTIDGTTETGYSGDPIVVLRGPVAAGVDGLTVNASGVVIKGLVINRFDDNGILVTGSGVATITDNFIGVDVDGDTARPNATGIRISSSVGGTVIGGASASDRNVISGNTFDGITVDSGGSNNIRNNYIGVDSSGTFDVGNGGEGIHLFTSGNTIGGPVQGNVISGNASVGIRTLGSSNNVIKGNFIGTNAGGNGVIANGTNGIRLGAGSAGNTIGGTGVSEGNIISGNNTTGIHIFSSGSNNNTIAGNWIGTNSANASGLGNGAGGIRDQNGGNVIGGTAAGSRNVISGNTGAGVSIDSADDAVIQGNYIGTNVAGTADLGNSLQGVYVNGTSDNALVGGSTAAARNVISGNDSIGVYMEGTGTGHRVSGNYIGTNAAGTGGVGNTSGGVAYYADGVLGGTAAGEGNVISGNLNHGVQVGMPSVEIYGNYIGTNAAGTAAVANTQYGINVLFMGAGTIIGAPGVNGRNVVSGNTFYGIKIFTASNVMTNNYVGVGADGTTAIANGSDGISVDASDNTIGRVTAGDGNIVANNSGFGVRIGTGDDNSIRGNYIYSNTAGGIDLGGGTNDSIAAPVFDVSLPPKGTVAGCGGCTIDVYSDAGAQGRYYEGTVTADGGGNWAFYGDVTSANLTATGTNADGSTSRFSAAKAVPPCSPVCIDGLWKVDFIDTTPPIFNNYCTTSVIQSGASAIWGELSCASGLLYDYSGSLTQGSNAISISLISSGGALATATGTFAGDGNSASGTWTCTFGCVDSGPWSGSRLNSVVTLSAGGDTESLGVGVPPATITSPPGSPAITVEAVTLENISGSFLRTGYDFTPHGQEFDPLNPVRMTITYNPTTDLPPGAVCSDLAHYRYDPLTGTSTLQSRVACGTNMFTVPITGFSVHRFEIGRDTDGDGVDDGPDVCPFIPDVAQLHSDSHILPLPSPPTNNADWTQPFGDDSGDACDIDGDRDNDGLSDTQEAAGCGFGPTSPTNRDSDGDLFIDSAECSLNKNPNLITDKPLMSACGTSGDADGDGINNQTEFCKYGTNPNNPNSDRGNFNIADDGCNDGAEAANQDKNFFVNVIDLQIVAGQAGGTYPLPGAPKKLNADYNKNGSVDVIDLGGVAQRHTGSVACQIPPAPP